MNNVLNFKNVVADNIDIEKWMSEDQITKVSTVATFVPKVMDIVNGKGEMGHPTPWKKANEKFSFRESELTVWTGYKGHGKSLFISQVFEKFLTDQKKVFIISPEFPPHRILYRMIVQSIGKHHMNVENAYAWMEAVEDQLLIYNQQSSLTALEVIALCRYAVEVHGVDHILIDSLMKCGIAPDDYAGQKRLIDTVQQVAHKNKVHIHLVAHSRKDKDDGSMPTIHDIKGSSELGDIAENVIVVWRNKKKEFGTGKMEEPDAMFKVEAQRNGNGDVFTVPLFFNKDNFTFFETP